MAVPPARWSQSSGWAPKAMTFNRPSVLGASVRGPGSCADTKVETVARAASAISPTGFHAFVETIRFIEPLLRDRAPPVRDVLLVEVAWQERLSHRRRRHSPRAGPIARNTAT